MATDKHGVGDGEESDSRDGCTAECYGIACFIWVHFIICELYPNKKPHRYKLSRGKERKARREISLLFSPQNTPFIEPGVPVGP